MSYAERFTQTKKTNFMDQARLAQQNYGSRLRATVTEYPMTGESSAPVLYYDKVKATRRTGRAAQITDNPANRRRRWLAFEATMNSGEVIDRDDVFKGMENFQSPLMSTHFGAVRRMIEDEAILTPLLGTAYEGQTMTTPIALPASQLIGVTTQAGVGVTAVGMNLEKIKASRKKFALADWDLDMEQPFLLLTAEQIDDLSAEIELKSADYVQEAGPAFSRTGKLSVVWNHQIIEYQALPFKTVSSDLCQRNVAYMKSAIALGVWQDVAAKTTTLPDRYDALYMWVEANMSGARLDETGVIEIESKI